MKKVCKVHDCLNDASSREVCRKHYSRWRRHGDTSVVLIRLPGDPKPICKVEVCPSVSLAKNLCSKHYNRELKYGSVDGKAGSHMLSEELSAGCVVDSCDNPRYARNWCANHYGAWRAHGDPEIRVNAPPGSGCRKRDGYRYLYKDGKSISEHRHTMQEILGRKLMPKETVHHKDGNRLNNAPENLELWSSNHPSGQRVVDKIEWSKDFMKTHLSPEEILAWAETLRKS